MVTKRQETGRVSRESSYCSVITTSSASTCHLHSELTVRMRPGLIPPWKTKKKKKKKQETGLQPSISTSSPGITWRPQRDETWPRGLNDAELNDLGTNISPNQWGHTTINILLWPGQRAESREDRLSLSRHHDTDDMIHPPSTNDLITRSSSIKLLLPSRLCTIFFYIMTIFSGSSQKLWIDTSCTACP